MKCQICGQQMVAVWVIDGDQVIVIWLCPITSVDRQIAEMESLCPVATC